MSDKVMKPVNQSRPGGVKQVSSAAIKGPTATMSNLSPYNRGSESKKK